MKPQTKVILSTSHIKILDNGNEYVVHIAFSYGGWIEHEPFQRDQQGLVAAILLAADVCSGKFYPRRVLSGPNTLRSIEFKDNEDEIV